MGATLPGKVRELVFATGSATGTRLVGRDLRSLIPPHVEREKSAPDGVVGPDQQFYGFSSRDRSGETYRRVQDSSRLTGFKGALRGIGENASQACGLTGKHIQRDSVAAYGCG